MRHSIKTWLRRGANTNAGSQPQDLEATAASAPPPLSERAVPKSATLVRVDEDLPPMAVGLDGSNSFSRRERFIITELIYAGLLPTASFAILDGGARGGPSDPRWRAIGDKRLVIHGFDVDEAECETLNRDAAERGLPHRYYACALWSAEGPLTVYGNKAPGGISAYPQNIDLTNRWKFQNSTQKFYARDIFYPTGETSVVTATTVDAWSRKNTIGNIDFFKLNVQGAELEILKGARDSLASVLGVDLEVAFVESYRGRPLFAEVDAFLRLNGFHFFDMLGLHNMGRADSPVTSMHTPGLNPYQGQLIEAHGLYFRDPIAARADLASFPPDRLLKLASIAEIYGQVEYAFELLGWLASGLVEAARSEEAARISELREAALRLHQRYLWAPPL